MEYFAHSGRGEARDDWQRLADHLVEVAKRAQAFGEPLSLGQMASVAGLFHDLGKYDPAFQTYIAKKSGSVDHPTAGAQILRELAQGADKAAAELIAYAILGHHAGLPDQRNDSNACLDMRMERQLRIDPAWRSELTPHMAGSLQAMSGELKRFIVSDRARQGFVLSFAGRMIFSCLVDADFKDTEVFYASIGERQADRDWPLLRDLIDGFLERFAAHMARFDDAPIASAETRRLNDLRRKISSHARDKAVMKPGFFTLTVPTGGGKTLASLGFALDHARAHGHRRIIFAIPFTEAWIETSMVSPISRPS